VAAIAAEMGQPLLPWQRYEADVSLEIDPSTGLLVYGEKLTTVQRQAGKTTLDLAESIQNALMTRGRRSWYTAQSGQHASEKFLEMADTWSESKVLSPLAKSPRRSNGSAALELRNGSKFRPFPPTEQALHGKQSDRVSIDELWYFTVTQLALIKQGLAPTQTTRRMKTGQRPQTAYWSTEGTVESGALNLMLAEARSSTPSPDMAFFDWGLADDDDPTDLAAVYAKHPGAGYLFEMADLVGFQNQFRDAPGEFARAYGNVRTGATERVIPAAEWAAAAWRPEEGLADPNAPVCFGAAHGVDGVDTSISATQLYGPGTLSGMVKDGHFPGTVEALPKLQELAAKYPNAAFAIDRYGPSATLYDQASRAGLNLIEIGSGDVIAATQATLADITNPKGPTWRYKPHPAYEDAAKLASKRYVGDGTWLFGRRASVGSISALESANLGSWGINHMPVVHGMQLF
jgi:hypothetical protein